MTLEDYRKPAHEIDMAAQEHAIRRDTSIAFAVTGVVFAGGYFLASAFAALPTSPGERLAFAALCWSVTGFVLLVAVIMVSTTRRFSAEDIGGQASGPPSDKLAIKAAFLQNTLEQTVLAAGFYFGLAAVAGEAWLAILPAAAMLFVVGRVLFYTGYRRGARGRALGMGLTMMPSALGYPIIAFLALFG